MSVRLRRLQADYEQIEKRFASSPHIVIRKATGNPPERYEIEYRVRGLVVKDDGEIVEASVHVAEIVLTRGYPRRPPQCKMLTPIFHPNIDPGAICIGDHWAASEALSDLIIRIGEIITYQSYNTKSPLNGEAARWADENGHLLPVDSTDLLPPEAREAPQPPPLPTAAQRALAGAATQCQNCGALGDQTPLRSCVSGHLVCADCSLECERCHSITCVLCQTNVCPVCGVRGCRECLKLCEACKQLVCPDHLMTCAQCGAEVCSSCAKTCPECGRTFCPDDFAICASCGQAVCTACKAQCAICPPQKSHHRSELTACGNCGAAVCKAHIHASAISGQTVCDICGTICASCQLWVTNAEASRCSICSADVCRDCLVTCSVCRNVVCPGHSLVCDRCGRTICTSCSFKCPTCGRTICRTKSHVGFCSVCSKPFCVDCLALCGECGKPFCADHGALCRICSTYVCSSYPCSQTCSSCGTRLHRAHISRCIVCELELCPRCTSTCDRCGATTCLQHSTSLSRGRTYCLPCYKRRDKIVAAVGLTATGVVVMLFFLLLYLLSR